MKVVGTKSLSKFVFFALFVLVFIYVQYFIFVVRNCNYSLDPIFSSSYKLLMQEKANALFRDKSFLKLPLTTLQEEFPLIKSIGATYNYGAKAHCSIQSHKPIVRVNNAIMVDSGKLYEEKFFDQTIINDLPLITLANNPESSKVPTRFLPMVFKIPRELFEQFHVSWIDHTRLLLQDKKVSSCSMIAHHTTVFNQRLLNHYESLKLLLMKRMLPKNKCWVFDVRFKNQIIVAQKERGLL